MKQIQAIYREEGKLSDFSTEDRLMQRQLVVKPLVDAFFAYLKQNEAKIPKNGKIREAFTYALNQESYLKVFLEDDISEFHYTVENGQWKHELK